MREKHTVRSSEQVVAVRRAAFNLAVQIGFSSVEQVTIGVVVSELARNILTHAGGGEVALSALPEGGILIVAHDEGAGIANPSEVFQRGHGLWAVQRGVDELAIERGPDGRGTRVTARKRARRRVGASSSAGEPSD